MKGTLHFDGSCNPNPGPNSSGGFVIRIGDETVSRTIVFGQGTNNTAEYLALINGLQAAIERGVTHLSVFGDSQIVIRGMKRGPWRGGAPHLEVLKKQALDLAKHFSSLSFTWIPRERNSEADLLSSSQKRKAG